MFIKGVDISTLKEVEQCGGTFYEDGMEKDLFQILKRNGINMIRLRLWVDPYDQEGKPYMGGTNDLGVTLELAKRAKREDMNILLDFHYSDFWADPKKQKKPKGWEELQGKALEDKVYTYTKEVLSALADEGVAPEYIQIGNETPNGLLWPDGKTPKYLAEEDRFEDMEEDLQRTAYDACARLLQAGVRATREVLSQAKIILHLDAGGAIKLYQRWFEEMERRKVDFDIVGMSYYPFWHGSMEQLKANIENVNRSFSKPTIVVETAYGFTAEDPPGGSSIFNQELAEKAGYPATVDGQRKFLTDLMTMLKDIPDQAGLGIVYWEPAWLPVKGTTWASHQGMLYGNDVAAPGNNWANQCLFDFNGNALPSLKAFK
ncbi:glycoside hydrolase family 53 protein [Aureibacillus halotolerans]|uniref:Arabinogalactan endo-beta-1,4-galactanase n=1 Tax=Aureibacillus halotolerans TaxID=1508390 RepID=A0A4R6UDR9_9BACI|nr:glycosyl hydrolase 53 family protein [Aureibacillus halotolerans]TDQ41244.1 arabinogalactan endo-1,4-beta-galactosidase [Aureibacillus halotolerans]